MSDTLEECSTPTNVHPLWGINVRYIGSMKHSFRCIFTVKHKRWVHRKGPVPSKREVRPVHRKHQSEERVNYKRQVHCKEQCQIHVTYQCRVHKKEQCQVQLNYQYQKHGKHVTWTYQNCTYHAILTVFFHLHILYEPWEQFLFWNYFVDVS